MVTTHKRHRISNLRLQEISTVDQPAQRGAVAVIMKSADTVSDVAIRKNAEAVVSGGDAAHSVADFEDAMFRRADELAAQQRITPEQALARGLSTDTTLKNLAHAGEVVRVAAYGVAARKRMGEAA